MSNINFTAIILSYKRPYNIQRICETILTVKTVDKLILSNNNPEIDLNQYLDINDSRFVLIDQKKITGCIKRYQLAYLENSKYYLCIDDDLFLTKEQIEYLMGKLVNDPTRPHGFWGQTLNFLNNRFSFDSKINEDLEIDILNRAYFFTHEHVIEMFNLMALSKTHIDSVGPCDDIFLSFSGLNDPAIHNIGRFEDCPTSDTSGIALWKEKDFYYNRLRTLKSVLEVRTINSMEEAENET